MSNNDSSFSEVFHTYDWQKIKSLIYNTTEKKVEKVLFKKSLSIDDYAVLLSPIAGKYIENLAEKSNTITKHRFGKTIGIYTPLYISNECENSCTYCGFNNSIDTKRITLSLDEIKKEIKLIKNLNIDNILIVSGDAPKKITIEYLKDIIKLLHDNFSNIGIEIYPLDSINYNKLIKCGLDGITIYQETYNYNNYLKLHPKGRKKNFFKRLTTPDITGLLGIRRIGIGSLLGLSDFRVDSFFTGLHAFYLMKKYWKTQISISFPRICPIDNINNYKTVTDRDLVQLICATRIFLNNCGIVISTRESAQLRNKLIPLGVTMMSAGSKTSPGGYIYNNNEKKQFDINDKRSPKEVIDYITNVGYDPVIKDWDKSFL